MSCLNSKRYSALDVNIRYGSVTPFVTKSSIKTPRYASSLFNTICSFPLTKQLAFIPAISPWAAASSYPLVPLTCPPKNNPFTFLDSKVGFNSNGSMASYSIAYAYFAILAFSKPGKE